VFSPILCHGISCTLGKSGQQEVKNMLAKVSTSFEQGLLNYFTCRKNSFGFPARDGHLSAVKGAQRASGL